ncbi:hypothetical protein [Nocardiopsis lucentensis]|uniref:hypothetical protein n=1 Tax=Nocardiopsis lucentensis TaxID=53441 RepID=UPI000344964E|nr:hypothetical protein [Nocardiopsis lucentensis]
MSIASLHYTPLCAMCDSEILARANRQKPVPGQYRSAASGRGDDSAGGGDLILPR